MMGKTSFLAGIGLGAGLVYFLDSEFGPRRRRRARARIDQWLGRPEALPFELAGEPELALRRRSDLPGFDFRPERDQGFPTTGVMLGVAGGALAAYGLARRGRIGKVARRVGVGIMTRGLDDLDLPGRIGIRERRRAVDLQKSVVIQAPVDRVFDFWRDYQHFPLFLSEVERVEDLGGGRSRWTIRSEPGRPLEWEARLTAMAPNELLAWQSEPGAVIPNRGEIRFEPAGGGTRVDIRICYTPPPDEAEVPELLGPDPRTRINHDIERIKGMLEAPAGGRPGSA